MLNFPDMSILMNEPMCHDPAWPLALANIPSDIMKFEGTSDKDPCDHVTAFDLWCSLNSLNDDLVHLRLFQCILTRVSAKWYIELPRGTYQNFHELSLVFLNHFQTSIRYDVTIEILSNFCQDKATHISDHIQKLCRRK
jgi:hypothetical protein